MVKIIKGDLVSNESLYPGEVGQASHSDHQGRWVVWRHRGGHWGAGVYKPSQLDFVGRPDSAQPKLKLINSRLR